MFEEDLLLKLMVIRVSWYVLRSSHLLPDHLCPGCLAWLPEKVCFLMKPVRNAWKETESAAHDVADVNSPCERSKSKKRNLHISGAF